jgi:hypothetical protein
MRCGHDAKKEEDNSSSVTAKITLSCSFHLNIVFVVTHTHIDEKLAQHEELARTATKKLYWSKVAQSENQNDKNSDIQDRYMEIAHPSNATQFQQYIL